ncbi:UDP-glucose 4-epimerase GalE [Gilliamella sp. B2717]|uniref:UDP-glucose 4-epimerase GalE n=1 Tax=Gilliamella sp. B2717 TaxID=2817996 RepID=UPI002269EBF5|nr:UDP-glucose 4-epimerase GalE [Gilliamella sp. B2717]MCX8578341.1 UDP-glucose 4-epimerase GalE [Gilliamella sp. B2717]
MKVFVTGGCGYIGSHTCVQLIKAGYTPIVIDNLFNSKASVLKRIQQITHQPINFYPGDVRDANLLAQIFNEHDIQAVIHFAGLKAVGESVYKPLEYYENNVYGSIVLMKAMRDAGVKQLVFSSSATVYGELAPVPYVETLPQGLPTSPYGKSKLMVEQCIMDLAIAEPDWSLTLLRYFNPVGAHPSGLIGEDPLGIPNNLMPFITQVAVGKRESLAVFGNDYPTQDGTCVRDFIHVVDLADGHIAALKADHNQPGVHIYNLGSGVGYSVLQVIEAFEKASGKPLKWHYAPRRAGDLPAFWADAKKAEQILGWKTQLTLDDMVRDSWNWQSNNPQGYPQD